jgi:hypothetical protein
MSNILYNGQDALIAVQAGQSLGVYPISGTYSACIVAGAANLPVRLATGLSTTAIFGPYATPVNILLDSAANSKISYDVGVTPSNTIPGYDSAGVAITGGTIRGQSLTTTPARTLVSPLRSGFRKTMATPPAAALNAATTIASPMLWPTVQATGSGSNAAIAGTSFSFARAGGRVVQGTSFPDYQFTRFSNVNYGGGSLGSGAYMVSLLHDGTAIEFSVKGITGAILCKVDDEFISLTPTVVPNDGAQKYFYIPFGTAKKRRIDFICYNSPFAGVFTAATDSVEPAPLRGPRTIIMGDSFTEGTGSNQVDSWVATFAEAMGWDDVWPSGVGATGYLAAPNPKLKYRDRFAGDVAAFSPSVVMFTGGINDNGSFTGAQVGAEAELLFQAAKAALPNALLVAVAPFWKSGAGTVPLNVWVMRDAIRTAIVAAGGIFIDPLEMPLPLGYVPQVTSLSANIGAGVSTLTVASPPVLRGTYKFPNGERFRVKAATGTGPFTVTTDTAIAGAHTSGEVITQVGDCFWTGQGNAGSLSGFGNGDIYVGADTTHPTVPGHAGLGQVVADLFIAAVS